MAKKKKKTEKIKKKSARIFFTIKLYNDNEYYYYYSMAIQWVWGLLIPMNFLFIIILIHICLRLFCYCYDNFFFRSQNKLSKCLDYSWFIDECFFFFAEWWKNLWNSKFAKIKSHLKFNSMIWQYMTLERNE